MPIPTILAKIMRSLTFITFRRIMNAGSDNPVTAIIKARLVPILTPFSVRTPMSGIIPAALE